MIAPDLEREYAPADGTYEMQEGTESERMTGGSAPDKGICRVHVP